MTSFKPAQRMLGCFLAAAIATAIPIAGGHAATTENFMARTTADYLALCNASPSQDNYVAAIHFCEGFAVGAYAFYQSEAAADASQRFVCAPNPAPSRDSIKAAYIAWVQSHPNMMTAAPVDSLFRYLGETYPCPK